MDSDTHADTEYLSTLERGLSVLRAFGRDNPQMTLSEVAEVTQLSPAAARRCLNTLVKLGYVAKHHRHFLLRPEVMSFASAYLDSMSLGELVRPHLQAVRDETGDSSSLAGAQRFRHSLSGSCVDQPDGPAGRRRGHALSRLCDVPGARDAGLRA
ncbi:MAG: helix-turn-helix domain-containing protein [Rhizomicrobium sp.]